MLASAASQHQPDNAMFAGNNHTFRLWLDTWHGGAKYDIRKNNVQKSIIITVWNILFWRAKEATDLEGSEGSSL